MTYNPIQVGQKTMANSQPVVLASDQTAVPVNATLQAGTAYAGKVRPTDGTNDITLNTAPADASSNAVTTLPVLSYLMGFNGTTWDRLRVDGSKNLLISLNTAIPAGANTIGAVTQASGPWSINLTQFGGVSASVGNGVSGTGVLRVTLASDSTGQVTLASGATAAVTQATASNLNGQAVGNIAHDSVDSGNPVKIGGKARQTNPTAVADADRADLFVDDVGRPVVVMNQCRDLVGSQNTTITSSTSETTIVTAAGAGVFADLTSLAITNKSATALIVTLKDSTAGTTRGIYAIAANGGIVLTFPTPKTQATANNNWTLTCGTSVDSVYVVAEFVKNV